MEVGVDFMVRSRTLFFFVFLNIFISSLGFAGGMGSGGGDVVACFENSTIAKNALNSDGKIFDEYVDQIKSLQVLDYFESEEINFIPNSSFATQQSITAKVKLRIKYASPRFYQELDRASSFIPISNWLALPVSLHNLKDSTPKKEIPKNCRLVQIAIRTNIFSNGQKNYQVQIDSRLFSLLDPFQQSMLRLHEEIYIVADRLGHYSSDKTRRLVRLAFSNETYLVYKARFNLMIGELDFGNYFKAFEEEIKQKSTSQSDEYSRLLSYISGRRKIEKRFKKRIDEISKRKMLKVAFKTFTDEEAFVFFTEELAQLHPHYGVIAKYGIYKDPDVSNSSYFMKSSCYAARDFADEKYDLSFLDIGIYDPNTNGILDALWRKPYGILRFFIDNLRALVTVGMTNIRLKTFATLRDRLWHLSHRANAYCESIEVIKKNELEVRTHMPLFEVRELIAGNGPDFHHHHEQKLYSNMKILFSNKITCIGYEKLLEKLNSLTDQKLKKALEVLIEPCKSNPQKIEEMVRSYQDLLANTEEIVELAKADFQKEQDFHFGQSEAILSIAYELALVQEKINPQEFVKKLQSIRDKLLQESLSLKYRVGVVQGFKQYLGEFSLLFISELDDLMSELTMLEADLAIELQFENL